MENAAKALVIAGGVLLAMLVLTMGVYLVGRLGEVTDSYTTTLDAAELQKYNSNFEVFVGRNDITAQEIITLISLAQQKEQGTIIEINGNSTCMTWENNHKSEFLQENIEASKVSGTIISYSYVTDSITYDTDGKVNKIGFKKN